jgi:hypothetical protein
VFDFGPERRGLVEDLKEEVSRLKYHLRMHEYIFALTHVNDKAYIRVTTCFIER